MKASATNMLIFSGVVFFASVGNAMAADEVQSEYASVLAACKSEAGNLSGASRDSFILKCRIEKTSREEKVRSCEAQMGQAISAKAQRDPELRAKFIDNCVKHWSPKKG